MQFPAIITTDQVALMIGTTVPLFRAKREHMIEDLGFPEPLPHCARPMRWRTNQVLAWLEAQGRPRDLPPPERPMGPNVFLLEEARRA